MKATVTYKKDGSVELSHNGTVEHFYSVSNMLNRMKELNIDVKLKDIITE